MMLLILLSLLRPVTEHREAVCVDVLNAHTSQVERVCVGKRVVVGWVAPEIRRNER